MICPKCGVVVLAGGKFCQCCGAKVGEPEASLNEGGASGKLRINMNGRSNGSEPRNDAKRSAPESASMPPSYVPPTAPSGSGGSFSPPAHTPVPFGTRYALPADRSFFDGTTLGYIGVRLLAWFLCTVTLGIAFPWAWCYEKRWVYEHTCINGYRLRFDGRGIQIIGKWLLWILLTILTLTIFAWCIPVRLKKWEVKHVSIGGVVIDPRS